MVENFSSQPIASEKALFIPLLKISVLLKTSPPYARFSCCFYPLILKIEKTFLHYPLETKTGFGLKILKKFHFSSDGSRRKRSFYARLKENFLLTFFAVK